jgi:hypothetical protein
MDTASFSVREGVLSYWDLGQETDPDTLRQGLDDLGYRGMSLNHRTYPMALKAALGLIDIPKTIVRKLKRDGQGRDGYAIVREDVKVDENEYDTVATARVDADGQVTVERGWGTVDEYQLRQKTAHFRRVLPAGSVSQVLVGLTQTLGGVTVRPTGGLYFVPAHKLDAWKAIAAVVERSATDGTENHISVVPFEFNSGTLRDIRRAIIAEVTAEAKEIADELRQGFKDDAAVTRRAFRACQLRAKTGEYERLLGETLVACRQALDEAANAVTVTQGVQESDAFADVF